MFSLFVNLFVPPTESSGGALYVSSTITSLNGTLFESNAAGDGPAVMNEGTIETMWGTTFNSNTFFCAEGTYGYDSSETTTEDVSLSPNDIS